jgi:hypothetical protein
MSKRDATAAFSVDGVTPTEMPDGNMDSQIVRAAIAGHLYDLVSSSRLSIYYRSLDQHRTFPLRQHR